MLSKQYSARFPMMQTSAKYFQDCCRGIIYQHQGTRRNQDTQAISGGWLRFKIVVLGACSRGPKKKHINKIPGERVVHLFSHLFFRPCSSYMFFNALCRKCRFSLQICGVVRFLNTSSRFQILYLFEFHSPGGNHLRRTRGEVC